MFFTDSTNVNFVVKTSSASTVWLYTGGFTLEKRITSVISVARHSVLPLTSRITREFTQVRSLVHLYTEIPGNENNGHPLYYTCVNISGYENNSI